MSVTGDANKTATMRIGEIAGVSNVSVQTIRYYERLGILSAPDRAPSGRRRYTGDAITRLRFIRRAQHLGFTLEEIRALLSLRRDSTRSCDSVERKARQTLIRIESRLDDLQRMRRALAKYVAACRSRRPLGECPLLAALGGERAETVELK